MELVAIDCHNQVSQKYRPSLALNFIQSINDKIRRAFRPTVISRALPRTDEKVLHLLREDMDRTKFVGSK